MNKKSVVRLVKELRQTLEMTQEQFAARIGVTFSTVNRWENGRGTPSPLAFKQLLELNESIKGENNE